MFQSMFFLRSLFSRLPKFRHFSFTKPPVFWVFALILTGLSACGGGGDSGPGFSIQRSSTATTSTSTTTSAAAVAADPTTYQIGSGVGASFSQGVASAGETALES